MTKCQDIILKLLGSFFMSRKIPEFLLEVLQQFVSLGNISDEIRRTPRPPKKSRHQIAPQRLIHPIRIKIQPLPRHLPNYRKEPLENNPPTQPLQILRILNITLRIHTRHHPFLHSMRFIMKHGDKIGGLVVLEFIGVPLGFFHAVGVDLTEAIE